jgi:hypothetical protein
MADQSTQNVLSEVLAERVAQDLQWGGHEHDDEHRHEMWDGLLWKFLRRAATAGDSPRNADKRALRRRALVQLAALAVAAIETQDREDLAQLPEAPSA